MLRQRIENIALWAFVTPFAACAALIEPPVDGTAHHMDCASAGCNVIVCSKVTQLANSASNLRPIPFSGLLSSWSLFRWACDVDLSQVAQRRIWLA